MAKKHRNQRPAKRVPWLMIFAVGGALLVLVTFFLANRSSSGGGGGTPKIAADPQKIDYGYVKFGNNETFKIEVSNAGGGVLRFMEKPYIEVLEGC